MIVSFGLFQGWMAEYVTVYTIDVETSKVVAVVVLNKNQVNGSSPRMEPEAVRLSLEFLENSGIPIRSFVSIFSVLFN